jgi:hypothetical protein
VRCESSRYAGAATRQDARAERKKSHLVVYSFNDRRYISVDSEFSKSWTLRLYKLDILIIAMTLTFRLQDKNDDAEHRSICPPDFPFFCHSPFCSVSDG